MNLDTISINQTLPAITCDYQSLREWAYGITAKYRDLTITEDQVKEIKADMAELNKAKQKLERARIDTVKEISAPIKKFEAEIKAISGLFDKAYSSLAEQVKVFEDAEKDRKREQIQAILVVECQQAKVDSDSIPFNPRWLNKTMSMAAIRSDIKALIQMRKEAKEAPLPPLQSFLANPDKCISEAQNTQKEGYPVRDTAQESVAAMEAQMAQERSDNPRTVWTMLFSYTPEQAEAVRQIFQECQFMRIVRRLDSIGIKATISKDEM